MRNLSLVMTAKAHANAVLAAIMDHDDAEYDRLVFGYLWGGEYATEAQHQREIMAEAALLVREKAAFRALRLSPSAEVLSLPDRPFVHAQE